MSFAFAGASQDLRLRRGGDRVDCNGLLVSRVGVVCSNGVNLGENEPVGPGICDRVYVIKAYFAFERATLATRANNITTASTGR